MSVNIEEKTNNYPCWFTEEAKAVANALVEYGYCSIIREEKEDLSFKIFSTHKWEIFGDQEFIVAWHDGVSYCIPAIDSKTSGEKILENTKKIIKNTVQKERNKYKRKYRQLSLEI